MNRWQRLEQKAKEMRQRERDAAKREYQRSIDAIDLVEVLEAEAEDEERSRKFTADEAEKGEG